MDSIASGRTPDENVPPPIPICMGSSGSLCLYLPLYWFVNLLHYLKVPTDTIVLSDGYITVEK